ncbi:hypothetical protein [Virgisporangium aurantiacum]|uniref:Uncharacterized protein n=1 Tax=Virgisporangium aurantiacum TaxID=175570 RepID=A0A8J3ZIK6_9ACTN|nr:hypothetical protein [Virgisporangium aurantiacum]GIJ64909.1 hypothetical protein Vau01_124250 [Virgisporangium aurantiacum]
MSNKLHHSTPRCGFRRLRIAVIGGSLTGPTIALLLLHTACDDRMPTAGGRRQ